MSLWTLLRRRQPAPREWCWTCRCSLGEGMCAVCLLARGELFPGEQLPDDEDRLEWLPATSDDNPDQESDDDGAEHGDGDQDGNQ